jgi:transposase-like protein
MTQAENKIDLNVFQEALIDSPDFLKNILSGALQRLVDAQFENHIRASRYERTEKRAGYRNGYYERQLRTRVGCISLTISRDRDGMFQPQLFARYQRNEKALVLAIIEMYLKGVSTRKIEPILEELCGLEISKSQVSDLSKGLDEEVQEWKKRPLEKAYRYLFVDALVHKVRENGKVVSKACLVGIGVREDGYREVVACGVADSESEQTWGAFFKELKERGLKGLELVISDDHAGLKKAIGIHFQGTQWQRCQVHFMRNFLSSFSKTEQGFWAEKLKDLFSAPELEQAKERAKALSELLRAKKKEKQAIWIDENIEECLSVYSFSKEHRKQLRTTNIAERFNLEIRRRTNVIGVFPSIESLMRILVSECIDKTEKWMEKKYLKMEREELLSKAM